jgi:membrane protease YdiL (CAAX protease family)
MYARVKGIPTWAAMPMLAAFLVEYPFYLVPAFPGLRDRFAGNRLPLYLLAAALLPYLAACCGAIPFHWISAGKLTVLALGMGFWYRVLPARPIVDIAFIAIVPCVLLGKYLVPVYTAHLPKFKDLIFLGHVTLIVIAVMVLLVERRVDDMRYGFIPNAREWKIGFLHFLYFIPAGAGLAVLLGAVQFVGVAPVWKIAGTFLGFLWTIALSEEFFCWGVLQPAFEKLSGHPPASAVVTSALFGLVHIGFGGGFPNWKWVLIAGVMGWFCGRAWRQSGSIRAAMVTHALVVATWRGFFK